MRYFTQVGFEGREVLLVYEENFPTYICFTGARIQRLQQKEHIASSGQYKFFIAVDTSPKSLDDVEIVVQMNGDGRSDSRLTVFSFIGVSTS